MAENKKSFILYVDLIHTVSKLPNDKAGELFKHVLEYVNGNNPETDDLIIQLTFEPIKQQLIRDHNKYLETKDFKKNAGILGNLKRWHPDLFDSVSKGSMSLEEAIIIAENRKTSQTDSYLSQPIANIADNVNDNDSVNDNKVSENEFSVSENINFIDQNTDPLETKSKTKKPKAKKVPGTDAKKIPHPSYGFIKDRFLNYYEFEKKTPYYFEAKDGEKINKIISKLKTLVKVKTPNITKEQEPDAINRSFNYIVRNMNDKFVIENLSLSMIDSKFNEIIAKIKQPKTETKESTSITVTTL